MNDDLEFHQKANELFEVELKYDEIDVIRVFDIENNVVLENINYFLLLFDDNLNIYKKTASGIEAVSNQKFKAVIVKKHVKSTN